MIFVAVTFLGIQFIVPRMSWREPLTGALCVIVASTIGALFGLSCTPARARFRFVWIVLGLLTAWTGLLGCGLAITEFQDRNGWRIGKEAVMLMLLLSGLTWFSACAAYRRDPPVRSTLLFNLVVFVLPAVLAHASVEPQTHDAEPTAADANALALVDDAFARADGAAVRATPKVSYVFTVLTSSVSGRQALPPMFPPLRGGKSKTVPPPPPFWDSTGRDRFIINNSGTIF
jgi:hypothetical protein